MGQMGKICGAATGAFMVIGLKYGKSEAAEEPLKQQTYALVRELRAQLKANAEDVGPHFAEEARKMHFGETPARSIYGEANAEERRKIGDTGCVAEGKP